MAYFVGQGVAQKGLITDIDDSAKYEVGRKAWDNNGMEYIYLKGVASTLAGSLVTYDEVGVTALLAANAIGPVALAMAATVANKYGWYMIDGYSTCQTAGDVADNGAVYATATAGKVDDAVVAGDRVKGAQFRGAGTGAIATVPLQVHFPFVDDIAD